MAEDNKVKNDMPSHKRKPALVPTIGAYCIVTLLAILAIGLVVSRSLSDITSLATNTRDEVLPAIFSRQRTAVNLERLGRFAETIYRSDDARIRRQYKLAAHILSQDSVFEDDNRVNLAVMDAYRDIEKIARLRNTQEQANNRSIALILQFSPGNAASDAMLRLKHGKEMIALLHTADKAKGLTALFELEEKFSALAKMSGASSQVETTALKDAHHFFTQRKTVFSANDVNKELWQGINDSLELLAGNLSLSAAFTADDSFTVIAKKADQAMLTSMLAGGALILALLVFLFLAQRDIVAPIIRYVQGLDEFGRGKKGLDLPEAKIRELDDIRMAVERSSMLMTQLADRTDALELEIEGRKKVQIELALAKGRAEAADRAKSDFLAGMSHEIRTPMNTILGMADLMLEADPTPEQRQYVEIFQSSGEMLLSIINDVLDLSKIEAGEISLEKTVINMSEFVERTREVVSGRAINKGLKFSIDVADDAPKQFIGDQVRLRQVLVNLIDNGVKFTDEGMVRLCIRRAEGGSPGTLTFSVSDSGIGIPEHAQKQIFRRFTQADASTTRKYGGTGLGLSICRRLVKLMGGNIRLESAHAQGSTFFFTIDFELPEQQKEIRVERPKGVADLIHTLSNGPVNILVAEDSDSNQALIELYFKKTTCHLDFAADGLEALEKYKSSSYDLVLMDIQMPVMDGHEATHEIRKYEKEHGIQPVPIVAVTANAFKEDQRRCLEAGCTDYLAKPVSKAGLLQCVARLVKGDEE